MRLWSTTLEANFESVTMKCTIYALSCCFILTVPVLWHCERNCNIHRHVGMHDPSLSCRCLMRKKVVLLKLAFSPQKIFLQHQNCQWRINNYDLCHSVHNFRSPNLTCITLNYWKNVMSSVWILTDSIETRLYQSIINTEGIAVCCLCLMNKNVALP